jgi:hypothetical protein
MRDEKQRTGTYHGEPSVGGAYVGGGRVLADAEHGVIAAGRRAGAGGIAGSGSGGGVHGSRAGQPSVDEVTRRPRENRARRCYCTMELGGRGGRLVVDLRI